MSIKSVARFAEQSIRTPTETSVLQVPEGCSKWGHGVGSLCESIDLEANEPVLQHRLAQPPFHLSHVQVTQGVVDPPRRRATLGRCG